MLNLAHEVPDMVKYVVKVSHKGLIAIPAELKRKYGIRECEEIILIDEGTFIVLVHRVRLADLYGSAKNYGKVIDEMIEEVYKERRIEACSKRG